MENEKMLSFLKKAKIRTDEAINISIILKGIT